MWYPSKPQWWVIWITLCLAFAVGAIADGGLMPAIFIALVGLLIIWRLGTPATPASSTETNEGEASKTDDSLERSTYQLVKDHRPFCVQCGTRLQTKWKHCPECGTKAQTTGNG